MQRRPSITGQRRKEILRSTVALLAEYGYDRLTFDALAQSAKISKASIYRHWHSKFGLVVEALKDQADRQQNVDRGSLRDDLKSAILDDDSVFQPVPFAAMNALVAALPRETNGTAEFVRAFWDENPQMIAIWERAVQRHDVTSDVDRDLVFAGLYYGLYHLTVLRGEPLDAATVERVLDNLVLPAADAPGRRP